MANEKKVRIWSKYHQGWLFGNKTFSGDAKLARAFESRTQAVSHTNDWFGYMKDEDDFEYQEFDVQDELARPDYWSEHEFAKLCRQTNHALFLAQKWLNRYCEADRELEIYSMRVKLGQIENAIKLQLDYKDGFNHRKEADGLEN